MYPQSCAANYLPDATLKPARSKSLNFQGVVEQPKIDYVHFRRLQQYQKVFRRVRIYVSS